MFNTLSAFHPGGLLYEPTSFVIQMYGGYICMHNQLVVDFIMLKVF